MSDFYTVLGEDADAYFARNGGKIERPRDPVLEALRMIHDLTPISRVLEIGCSTGWRLEQVRQETGAKAVGLEASRTAVERGQVEYPDVQLVLGVAPRDLETLRQATGSEPFDCVVVGFIEYLIPRESLFAFAYEVDRLVAEGGHLIIFDFLSPRPIRRQYGHDERLSIYKSDPSEPWTWSPTYNLIGRELFLGERSRDHFTESSHWMAVDTLRKLPVEGAYPPTP